MLFGEFLKVGLVMGLMGLLMAGYGGLMGDTKWTYEVN